MNKDVRNRPVTCLMTKREYERLKKHAFSKDISVSALMRRLALEEISK
ncbi:MAG TPA: hypothetical protein VEP90_15540 [Methylomirabilota bacterium]|nr:hypothetical protein [Methylomirabilota bacterium]